MLYPAQAAFADMPTPKVVVTVEPLKPYVDDILRGVTESTSIMKAGQDPHAAALSPSQARALMEADIIIMPSETMAPKLMRILEKRKKEGAFVIGLITLPKADPLPFAKENPWLTARKKLVKEEGEKEEHGKQHEKSEAEEGHEHEHEHVDDVAHAKATTDPHLWLDPKRMADIALPLADAMSVNTPYYRETFRANARKLATHLRMEVDPAIRYILKARKRNAPLGNKPFVPFLTYHPAYQYFLKRYKLDEAGFIVAVPEEYLGARSVRDTLNSAESINLRCLISETDSHLVRRIADASGAEVVTINPERSYTAEETGIAPWAKNDYERLLYKVAVGFAGCL